MPFIPEKEHGKAFCGMVACWAGARDKGEEAFSPIRSLGPTVGELVTPMPYPAINALFVNVDTSNGQVTLSGKVALPEQKAEAEKVARGVDGVKDVVNQLQVTGQTPAK